MTCTKCGNSILTPGVSYGINPNPVCKCLGSRPPNQTTGQPACDCPNCNATTGGNDLAYTDHQGHVYGPSNPPLSAPTNTDELDEILLAHRNDMAAIQQGKSNGLDIGTSANNAKSKIARLIALKQREEVARFNTHRHYGMDYQDSMDELADYKEKRMAQLNTIIEGENHG